MLCIHYSQIMCIHTGATVLCIIKKNAFGCSLSLLYMMHFKYLFSVKNVRTRAQRIGCCEVHLQVHAKLCKITAISFVTILKIDKDFVFYFCYHSFTHYSCLMPWALQSFFFCFFISFSLVGLTPWKLYIEEAYSVQNKKATYKLLEKCNTHERGTHLCLICDYFFFCTRYNANAEFWFA